MTHAELHEIKDFAGLFEDRRFKALMIYMRENPNPKKNAALNEPTAIIRSEGAWHGWFECLSEQENLRHPPRPIPTKSERQPPYRPPEPTQHP